MDEWQIREENQKQWWRMLGAQRGLPNREAILRHLHQEKQERALEAIRRRKADGLPPLDRSDEQRSREDKIKAVRQAMDDLDREFGFDD